jgi:DNA end-binding protein Ku
MARALWSGSISFGLVNAPVRLYPAVHEHDLELHLVHVKDGSPIGYRKYCKKEGKAVADKDIAKAYKSNGKLVLLEDEDFEAAQGGTYKTIEILDFVPYEQIDPIYFERTYYLGPEQGAEKVYALLVAAMERSELAGIVRYVFHDRERLGCLRVRDGALVVERMYFADEIRPHDEIRPKRRRKVDDQELELALSLIERITSDFDPGKYEDRYRRRLLQVIREKRKGKTVEAPAAEERAEPPDLLAALRESVERAQRGNDTNGGRSSGGNGSRRGNGKSTNDLGELSVKELNKRARTLDIGGRSSMTKRELVSAIRKAER